MTKEISPQIQELILNTTCPHYNVEYPQAPSIYEISKFYHETKYQRKNVIHKFFDMINVLYTVNLQERVRKMYG